MKIYALTGIVALALSLGCGVADPAPTPENIGGKADDDSLVVDPDYDHPALAEREAVHGVRGGSYVAVGLLKLANEATLDQLDLEARLDVRAAKAIVYGRNTIGTYTSLSQLDERPYVAKSAFKKLAKYATDEGWAPACGDGEHYELLEACDDGNLEDNDNCNTACQLTSTCGDSKIEGYEMCDDGNTDDDDGCNSSCIFEVLDSNGGVDPQPIGTYRSLSGKMDVRWSAVTDTWALDLAERSTVRIDYKANNNVTCYYNEHAGWPLVYHHTDHASGSVTIRRDQQQIKTFSTSYSTAETGIDAELTLEPGRYLIVIKGDKVCYASVAKVHEINYGMVLEVESLGGPVCGDGKIEGNEKCDDGNTDNNDGCDVGCQPEYLVEVEPNDSFDLAQPVGSYTHVDGHTKAGDEDWFSVELAEPGDLTLAVSCWGQDTLLTLYADDGTELAEDDDGNFGRCSKIEMEDLAAGTYVVKLRQYDETLTGDYTLSLFR